MADDGSGSCGLFLSQVVVDRDGVEIVAFDDRRYERLEACILAEWQIVAKILFDRVLYQPALCRDLFNVNLLVAALALAEADIEQQQ